MKNYFCKKCGKLVLVLEKGKIKTGTVFSCAKCSELSEGLDFAEKLKNATSSKSKGGSNPFGSNPFDSSGFGDLFGDLFNKK